MGGRRRPARQYAVWLAACVFLLPIAELRPTSQQVATGTPTEAPDTFWCPMHPAVRSPVPGKCPVCTMDLVALRPPRVGEYHMDVRVLPSRDSGGPAGLRLLLTDPDRDAEVSDMVTVHEKPLHVFVISRDLEYFAHLHPTQKADHSFVLDPILPPGAYVVIADFLPRDGSPQMLHRAIVVPGPRASPVTPKAPTLDIDIPHPGSRPGSAAWGTTEKVVDGVRVRLEAADFVAGQTALLRFSLLNASDGSTISDLEPFLGAPAHLLMTTASLSDSVHGHPEENTLQSPVITFRPSLPGPGPLKLWIQFQRRGRLSVASFVLDVLEP